MYVELAWEAKSNVHSNTPFLQFLEMGAITTLRKDVKTFLKKYPKTLPSGNDNKRRLGAEMKDHLLVFALIHLNVFSYLSFILVNLGDQ